MTDAFKQLVTAISHVMDTLSEEQRKELTEAVDALKVERNEMEDDLK